MDFTTEYDIQEGLLTEDQYLGAGISWLLEEV